MRILIITQYFWPESFRINEVAHTLRDEGHDVLILTGKPNYPDGLIYKGYSVWRIQSEIIDGIKIIRVPIIPRGCANFFLLVMNYLSFIFSAFFLGAWALRSDSFNCILVYAPSPILQAIPAIWLGKLKNTKVAIWVQDLWPESLTATGFIKNAFILKCVSRLVRWIYSSSDLLLAQSLTFVEPIRKLSGGTPVIFHPNPGELAFSAKNSDLAKVILKPGFNIVFAGNLGSVQALPTILDAAFQLRDEGNIRFVLVGGGSRLAWLQDQITELDLKNVILLGRFPSDAMPDILRQASVLLVSLIKNPIMSLTVPGKVQAYLAARKPIIASMDGEGARIVMEAEAGIACPAEDASALACAVMEMHSKSSVELIKMGDLAGEYYEKNFEPRMLAAQLGDTLSKMISD